MTIVISEFWLGVIMAHLFWLTVMIGIACFNTWREKRGRGNGPGVN